MLKPSIIAMIILLCVKVSVFGSDEQAAKERTVKIVPFPIVAYSPDTRFVGGAGAIINSTPENQNLEEDNIKIMAFYTQNKQYKLLAESEWYFLNNFLQVRCDASTEKYPSEYYGIGPDTPISMKEKYTYKDISFFFAPLAKVIDALYIGPAFDFTRYNIEKSETGGEIDRMSADSRLTKTPGIGGIISYDTRKDGFYIYSGELIEIDFIRYSEKMGSAYNFNKFSVNLKKYYKLYSSVICGQIYTEILNGDIPFYSYPSVGGDDVNQLRGYLNDRYIDKFLTNIQIEYRSPTIWRFGVVIFAGIGEVEHKFSAFTNHPHAAGGAGIRFMIDKESKINVRIDFAYNGNDVLTYFNILEAF